MAQQAGAGPGDILPNWTILVTGFVPFLIFLLAGTAEIERPPFDLLEAEQELVAGFNTEYSGIRFALFYLASFMNTITTSAIIVTLFLGGPPVRCCSDPTGSGRCSGSSARCWCSSSSSCGSAPRCRATATTN